MINSLPLFHNLRGQKVLILGDGEAAEPKKRLVKRAGGIIEDDIQTAINEGVRLAFIAYDSPDSCKSAAINLRCAGMLVNVVDMPDLCDFTTPSILDRSPVIIAVGTGGASAGLAKHIRLRLEQFLPQTLGELAQGLFRVRSRLRDKFPDGSQRRQVLDEALSEGGPLDPLRFESNLAIESWLAESSEKKANNQHIIQLISEHPDDLTLKQARLLGMADVIVLVGSIPETILARARADAQRIPEKLFSHTPTTKVVVRIIEPT